MSLSQVLDKSVVPNREILQTPVLVDASAVDSFTVKYHDPKIPTVSALSVNNGGSLVQLVDAVGGSLTIDSYTRNTPGWYYTAGTWSPTINYAGANNVMLVVYGVNTAAVGAYPNNLWFADDAAPTPPVVGTPPTSSAVPYPPAPVPNAGWVLAATANFFGGAAVVNASGELITEQTLITGTQPGTKVFFGGGGASVGASVPRGVSILEADISTITGNNGAQLLCSGVVQSDGQAYFATDQVNSPASSYNATFSGAPNQFEIGHNYVWAQTGPGATTYHWDVDITPAVPGESTIGGNAFDTNSMIFLQGYIAAGATAVGNLRVLAKTNNSITVQSINALGALEVADVQRFDWVCLNPRWDT